MNKNILIFLLLSFILSFVTGCQTFMTKAGYEKKDKIEQQISKTQQEYNLKLIEKDSEIARIRKHI